MSVTYTELRSRVYEAMDVESSAIPTLDVDAWIKRAMVALAPLADQHDLLWDVLSPLERRHEKKIENNAVSLPSSYLWLRMRGDVSGRMVGRVVASGALPSTLDEYNRPTTASPWLVVTGTSATACTVEVLPKHFNGHMLRIAYLKEPEGSDVYSETLADLLVCGAAKIGCAALEETQRLAIVDNQYREALARFGIGKE